MVSIHRPYRAALVALAFAGLVVAPGCTSPTEAESTEQADEAKATTIQAPLRLHACGTVDGYAAADVHADGALRLGGKQIFIAPGAVIDGDALLIVNAAVCVDASLNLGGKIDGGHVSGGAPDADAGSPPPSGSGTPMQPPATSGSPMTPPSSSASPPPSDSGTPMPPPPSTGPRPPIHVDLDVCGRVDAFIKATDKADGRLDIAGLTFPIDAGVELVDEVLVIVDANICVHAHLDASARLSAPTSVRLNLFADATAHVCGTVKVFADATADVDGLLAIDAAHLVLAADAAIDGIAKVRVDANVCIDAKLDVVGRVRTGEITIQ